jgi:hypothetical protein
LRVVNDAPPEQHTGRDELGHYNQTTVS